MHDELAQQAGRPSKGCEFRACGDTRTLNPTCPQSARPADRRVRQASPALDMAFGAAARTCHRCDPTRQVRFSCVVPCREIRIVHGPVGTDIVTALQLQVGRQETERRAKPMPRGPADQPQIRAAKGVRPNLSDVSILYCCRALGIGGHSKGASGTLTGARSKSLHGDAAVNVRASLNDGHPRPGIGQAPRHQRTGNAGAHDQYVGSSVKRHSSDIGRRGSPTFRTAAANARRWIHSGRSPHQSGVETSHFGQSIQLEKTGIPNIEQSLLERCAAIGVWLEIGQALGSDARAEKQVQASSSSVGWKISEASRRPGPPQKPRMQLARRAGLSTHPCDWRETEYRRR